MKKLAKGIIKLLVFLIIFYLLFYGINQVLKRKASYEKNADFFEQKEEYDVLFFGSSHMLCSVYPTELWKDYGIVSYNLGNSGESLVVTYHNMVLALKEHKPKLAVIDAYLVAKDEKEVNNKAYLHTSLDAYPISYEKYNAIKDIFGTNNLLENEIEYLFNFSLYHSRWKELSQDDFQEVNKYQKGAELKSNVAKPNSMTNFDEVEMYTGEETISMQYLKKIIELCQANDIEVLITYMPYPANNNNIAYSKYIPTICDKYNVNYINFLSMDIVDYNTDCQDADSHLNVSGGRKITKYIGKYIVENYDIEDQRENPKYSFWNDEYNEYIDFKIKNLKANSNNIKNHLMLLYGENDINYRIIFSSSFKINSTLKEILANINNEYKVNDDFFTEHEDKNALVITYDNRNGNLIKYAWF